MAGGREAQEAKARAYLTSGQVSAVAVDLGGGTARFEVTGSSDTPYNVHFQYGAWACDCPARVNPCAHVLACSLVCRLRPNETEGPTLAPAAARNTEVDELLALSLHERDPAALAAIARESDEVSAVMRGLGLQDL